MARYIDADTIPWEGFPNDYGEYHEDYVEKRVVDKMPAIDAVEVVRCKDCAKCEPTVGGRYLCSRIAFKWSGLMCGAVEMKADDFCSYGVKKEVQDG